MEGASRGSLTRWGFEYTVPITLRRYAPNRTPRRHPATTEQGAASTVPRASAPGKADTVIVTIRDFRFTQERVTVDAGDVVVWRNEDPVAHTIVSDSGGFSSPIIEPRKEWSLRFATPGTFTYFCQPHPFMKARIRVNEVKP
jgi:plastocyanin